MKMGAIEEEERNSQTNQYQNLIHNLWDVTYMPSGAYEGKEHTTYIEYYIKMSNFHIWKCLNSTAATKIVVLVLLRLLFTCNYCE